MHVIFGAILEKLLEMLSDVNIRPSKRAYEAYQAAWSNRGTAPDEVELSLKFEQWSTPTAELDPDDPKLEGWFQAWEMGLPPRMARKHAKRH